LTEEGELKKMGSVLDLFADLTEPAIGDAGKQHGQSAKPLMIALADIQPDPNQPRKEFDPDQIANLAESIRKVGILQPLLLAETSATPRYQIIEGERRWRAAHLAGLLEVPAYVKRDLSDEQISLAQVIANANRTDLTDFELALAIQTLLDTHRIKKKEVAVLINRSTFVVSRLLGMLNPEIRTYVEEGLIRHAEACARFHSLPQDQKITLLQKARADGTEITTTMIREFKLPTQDTATSSGETNRSPETDASVNDGGLAAADHLLLSPSDSDSSALVLESGSVGLDGHDGTANGSLSAGTGDKANRRKTIIDLKATVENLRGLATLLSSLEPLETLRQQPIIVRIPHQYGLALVKATGQTLPENPTEYANTILRLLKPNTT
jgi:ParB family transcriptional regulator, chromosome partitioning protein